MTFRYIWILLLLIPVLIILYKVVLLNFKSYDKIFTKGYEKIIINNYRSFNYNSFKMKNIFFIIGIVFLIFSSTGPRFGTKLRKVDRQGVDLVIVFDTSVSMDAQDVKPSRIEKAKFEISKLIKSLRGDRVSIIVFAGTSHLFLPLTTDYEAALLFLNDIDTKMIPNQGTSISSAMQRAIDLISIDKEKYKVILLVTDGEDHEGEAIALAEKASSLDISIFTIGIGSDKGSLIPISSNKKNQMEYKRDNNGKLITSVINKNLLKEIALAGNGEFFHFNNNGATHNDVLLNINNMEKRAINTHEYSEYEDRYQSLAFLSLILFIISIVYPTRVKKINE